MNGTPEIGRNLMPRFDNWADSANQNAGLCPIIESEIAIISNFMITKVGCVFLMTTVFVLDEMTMWNSTLRT